MISNSPDGSFGYTKQPDLFNDGEPDIENMPDGKDESSAENITPPDFNSLCALFKELTSYEASAYGFNDPEKDLGRLKNLIEDLKKQKDRQGIIQILTGLASDSDKDLEWWQK